jgi:hypothetical protein
VSSADHTILASIVVAPAHPSDFNIVPQPSPLASFVIAAARPSRTTR